MGLTFRSKVKTNEILFAMYCEQVINLCLVACLGSKLVLCFVFCTFERAKTSNVKLEKNQSQLKLVDQCIRSQTVSCHFWTCLFPFS